MNTYPLEIVLQIITILGGVVALFLALMQIIDTYLDIGEKLRKARPKSAKARRGK